MYRRIGAIAWLGLAFGAGCEQVLGLGEYAPASSSLDPTSDANATGTSDEAGQSDALQTGEGSVGSCGSGRASCDGRCVDLSTDSDNCGACGNVCRTGACGTSIAADMTTMPAGWNLNGSAQWDGTTASGVVTPAALFVTGGIVFSHPVVVDEFVATFDFRIGYQSTSRDDGMGFMFETAGPSSLGGPGGQLGMVGLGGYGVELDIYDNGACGDMDGDHVGIDDLSPTCYASGDALPSSLAAAGLTGVIDLGDAKWHTAQVTLAASALSVTVDGHPTVTTVPLGGFVPGAQPYYFGFAAACGGGGNGTRMEVRRVAIGFPTPRCL